jgi:UDP-N-acetylmuramoylalanine--D-glutamate ligase
VTGAFAGQRAVVIGAATSGFAASRVLRDEGATVWISERGDTPEGEPPVDVRILAGGHRPEHLDGATLVIASPGVPEGADVLRWASDRGLPIWSELELGARLCRVPYVAVTGTNGKTTTTDLIASCIREAGTDAVACGNIGHPFSLAARASHAALVVEASSFQLRFAPSLHPRVSVLLNLADDHLDWHASPQAYRHAKANILRRQSGNDVHVGNRDDDVAATVSRSARCRVVWFTLGAPSDGEVGYEHGDVVARLDASIRLPGIAGAGAGVRADAAAAVAASLAFGVPAEAVASALARFSPLPHRGNVVATLGGVRFVDDSKATNPHAALAALDDVRGAVLIAGGRSKDVDLSPLTRAADRLVAVVAIGEAASELERIFDGLLEVRVEASMEAAVRTAASLAPAGGTVLLAPACASQDMFRDYRDRGDRFALAAAAIAQEACAHG